jgi:hypothetical protein
VADRVRLVYLDEYRLGVVWHVFTARNRRVLCRRFCPPAFLWMLVAYMRRGADFDEAAGQIRQGMSRLTYPADDATDRSGG